MTFEQLKALKGRTPQILGHERFFKSAVLLPLVEYQGEECVLFEERSRFLVRQPGEICFPGGRIEKTDTTSEAAAVRETCEELGLTPEDIEVIAPLDILVAPFNSVIYPFLCRIEDHDRIHPNHEVESLLYVPLQYLLAAEPIFNYISVKLTPSEDFPYELIPNGTQYDWKSGIYPEYFYKWQGYVIWGLTARILRHFLDLVRGLAK